MAGAGPSAVEDASWRRLVAWVDIAAAHRTAVPLQEVVDLLPEGAPTTAPGLAEWIRDRSSELSVVDGRIVHGLAQAPADLGDRSARADRYLRVAESLLSGPLARTRPWVQVIGVTGSTAYGDPEPGDDLDFLVIVRPGTVWLFLLYTFLAVRRARAEGAVLNGSIEPCFNYVLDDVQAAREFARPRGLLVAREAMTTRTLWGTDVYRGLLLRTTWLEHELPRLYGRWASGGPGASPAPSVGPWTRLANALLFPPFAAYLHLTGALRNRRFRREGLPERSFVTETGLARMAVRSERFDRLSQRYDASFAHGGRA